MELVLVGLVIVFALSLRELLRAWAEQRQARRLAKFVLANDWRRTGSFHAAVNLWSLSLLFLFAFWWWGR